jgi:hypothetical protein
MAVTFVDTIKPYFTPCYRAHMLKYASIDLWDPADVKGNFDVILRRCSYLPDDPVHWEQSMPAPGCPEGVWDKLTRDQFKTDFQAWKDAIPPFP